MNTKTSEASPHEANRKDLPETFSIDECDEAFVRDFCPYKGSPDPHIVWRAAWQTAIEHAKANGSAATRDVLAERQRQIKKEGWTPEHDDGHDTGRLAEAAACYALAGRARNGLIESLWPWKTSDWKPRDTRRNLIKAGALILAEIERLDRYEDMEHEEK